MHVDEEQRAARRRERKAKLDNSRIMGMRPDTVGIISVVLVTALWIASSFLTKNILGDFDKPFFLTYLSIAAQQIYYIFLAVPDPLDHHLLKQEELINNLDNEEKQEMTENEESGGRSSVRPRPRTPSVSVAMAQPVFFGDSPTSSSSSDEPVTGREMLRLGASLFLIYLAALYLSYLSYQYTSVGSATITGSTSGVFLLMLGCLFRFDRFTMIKTAATIATLMGCLILVVAEWGLGGDRIVGNLMGLASSFCYALYSVLLHRLAKDPFRVSNPLLFAVIGTFTTLLAWPMFLILHYRGLETFVLPEDASSWGSIIFNVVAGSLLPNYLWNVAYTLTTPFKCALGMAVTIPAVLLLEAASGEPVTMAVYFSGFLLVVGFLCMNSEKAMPGQST